VKRFFCNRWESNDKAAGVELGTSFTLQHLRGAAGSILQPCSICLRRTVKHVPSSTPGPGGVFCSDKKQDRTGRESVPAKREAAGVDRRQSGTGPRPLTTRPRCFFALFFGRQWGR
jgi:hypothetical protein